MTRRRKSTRNKKAGTPAKKQGQTPSNVFREPARKPNSVVGSQVQLEQFSGPVPHPTILAGYEKVVPGSAERIINDAMNNSAHQRLMEKNALSAARWETHIGQGSAVVVIILAFVTSVVFVYFGHPIEGTILGGATLASIVATLIKGRDGK